VKSIMAFLCWRRHTRDSKLYCFEDYNPMWSQYWKSTVWIEDEKVYFMPSTLSNVTSTGECVSTVVPLQILKLHKTALIELGKAMEEFHALTNHRC
jgi:hypothetical protein